MSVGEGGGSESLKYKEGDFVVPASFSLHRQTHLLCEGSSPVNRFPCCLYRSPVYRTHYSEITASITLVMCSGLRFFRSLLLSQTLLTSFVAEKRVCDPLPRFQDRRVSRVTPRTQAPRPLSLSPKAVPPQVHKRTRRLFLIRTQFVPVLPTFVPRPCDPRTPSDHSM